MAVLLLSFINNFFLCLVVIVAMVFSIAFFVSSKKFLRPYFLFPSSYAPAANSSLPSNRYTTKIKRHICRK